MLIEKGGRGGNVWWVGGEAEEEKEGGFRIRIRDFLVNWLVGCLVDCLLACFSFLLFFFFFFFFWCG